MAQQNTGSAWLSTFKGILPAAGLYAAGVLTLTYLEGINVPCGESAGCELVSKSPIAAPAGIPIALVGAIAYMFLIICAFVGIGRSEVSRVFQNIGYALAAFGSLISVGLTLYSVRVIGATCRWCLASTLIFCLLLILYALTASQEQTVSPPVIRIQRFVTFWATFISIWGVLSTTHTLQYEAPVVNARVLKTTKIEDLIPDRAPSLGDKNATFILVFFGDLQCRACKEALPALAKEIQATPGTRLVYRYNPLSFHDFAKEAAVAAESSRKTVGFWPFVWKLYDNPDYLDLSYLRECERWAKLGQNVVDGKFDDPDSEAQVDADRAFGQKLGVKGTPTILIIEGKNVSPSSYRAALDKIREFKYSKAHEHSHQTGKQPKVSV